MTVRAQPPHVMPWTSSSMMPAGEVLWNSMFMCSKPAPVALDQSRGAATNVIRSPSIARWKRGEKTDRADVVSIASFTIVIRVFRWRDALGICLPEIERTYGLISSLKK